MQNDDTALTQAPIPQLIQRIATPVVIGFFFNTMFNVVGTYFGGKLSTQALAALSLTFPIYFLIIIFDAGISTGTTAIISNAVGAKDDNAVKKYAGQSLSFGIVMGIFISVFGYLVSPFLFTLLGATEEYLALALQYMNVIFIGSIFFMMFSVFNSLLQARGNTRDLRNFLIGGFFLNLILVPWFLFGGYGLPKMGLQGVALATVVVEALGALYIFIQAHRYGYLNRDILSYMIPDRKIFFEIMRHAIPASINLLSVGLGIFVVTYFVSHFGPSAVAAYGIATRIEQVAILPIVGITIACLTIVGQNNGAHNYKRVREAIRTSIKYGLTIMGIGGIAVFISSWHIMSFFTSDLEVIEMGAGYLRIASFIFLAYAILFISVATLQGLKHSMFALWIDVLSRIAIPIVIFLTLIYNYKANVYGIWWGFLAITWSAALGAFYYAKKIVDKLES